MPLADGAASCPATGLKTTGVSALSSESESTHPPRGRVRALLRKTSALADDAALPGPAIEGAGAIMMRTAGGGKVVAGLIDGKNAPPPGTVDLLSRLGQVDIS